jgi:hypothetical protein
MCFLFGLEILRLVYKKRFGNIEWSLWFLTFYPPKKVAPPLKRVEKNFFEIGLKGHQKKRIVLISKMCEVLSLVKGEIFFTEILIFSKKV